MCSGMFRDRFGNVLGSFWECFGIVLELFFIGFIITRIEAARSAADNSSYNIILLSYYPISTCEDDSINSNLQGLSEPRVPGMKKG